jgi:hypothetical protein
LFIETTELAPNVEFWPTAMPPLMIKAPVFSDDETVKEAKYELPDVPMPPWQQIAPVAPFVALMFEFVKI